MGDTASGESALSGGEWAGSRRAAWEGVSGNSARWLRSFDPERGDVSALGEDREAGAWHLSTSWDFQ